LLSSATLMAQASFEVASIKLNASLDRSSFTRRSGDSLVLQNWPLRDIILKAYGLKNYALDAPEWLASRSFDINAKAAGPVTDSEVGRMLQTLLAERFQLRVHRASKDVQSYVLLPVDKGFKLKAIQVDGVCGVDVSRFPDKTKLTFRNCTMDQFAEALADQVNRPVADQSGITGQYTFTLEWSPLGDTGPSAFSALNEQLGMHLEPRKLPIPVLIVDSISRTPTEN
jgi:uncharacterized protein (TIGR03435 family)